MNNKKGIIISIEGGEGSGKSTILNKINTLLNTKNINYILTREPGGVDIAEQIREVILNKKNTSMDGLTEAFLYASARRQHLIEKVIPALNNGYVVLFDRYIDSSLAYQGYARGLGIDKVYKLNELAIGEYMPDLTLYLDIPPEIGLNRINANLNREFNRLDAESLAFHHSVREGYLKLLELFPERIKLVNANDSIENVTENIYKIITDFLF